MNFVGYYPTCTDAQNIQGWGHGGGGGGVLMAKTDIVEGCTYPVTVGAGGACGCLKPDCWVNLEALVPTVVIVVLVDIVFSVVVVQERRHSIDVPVGTNDICCTNCQWNPNPTNGPGKFVGNKVGANMGSMFTGCGCYSNPCNIQKRSVYVASGAHPDINSFRSIDRCSAGGGFQATYYGAQTPPNTSQGYMSNQSVNYAVSDGHFLEYPEEGSAPPDGKLYHILWFGNHPCDTCNPACCDRIVYCCGPSCNYGYCSLSWADSGCFAVNGNIPVLNFGLGNSRIGRRQVHQKCMNPISQILCGTPGSLFTSTKRSIYLHQERLFSTKYPTYWWWWTE